MLKEFQLIKLYCAVCHHYNTALVAQAQRCSNNFCPKFTDVLDSDGVLRLIMVIPSPKAEKIELWIAKIISEGKTVVLPEPFRPAKAKTIGLLLKTYLVNSLKILLTVLISVIFPT